MPALNSRSSSTPATELPIATAMCEPVETTEHTTIVLVAFAVTRQNSEEHGSNNRQKTIGPTLLHSGETITIACSIIGQSGT